MYPLNRFFALRILLICRNSRVDLRPGNPRCWRARRDGRPTIARSMLSCGTRNLRSSTRLDRWCTEQRKISANSCSEKLSLPAGINEATMFSPLFLARLLCAFFWAGLRRAHLLWRSIAFARCFRPEAKPSSPGARRRHRDKDGPLFSPNFEELKVRHSRPSRPRDELAPAFRLSRA